VLTPDGDDWLASGRFARRAALLWGLAPPEARALFLLCCGHTDYASVGRVDGLTGRTIRENMRRVHRKLGTRGGSASAAAVRRAWPLYRASARPTKGERHEAA
jgi:DNA-binding CsgD family transcriptional regulator